MSSLIFLKRGIVYVVSWYMMPCTCSMIPNIMCSTSLQACIQEASILLVLITVAFGRPYPVSARTEDEMEVMEYCGEAKYPRAVMVSYVVYVFVCACVCNEIESECKHLHCHHHHCHMYMCS